MDWYHSEDTQIYRMSHFGKVPDVGGWYLTKCFGENAKNHHFLVQNYKPDNSGRLVLFQVWVDTSVSKYNFLKYWWFFLLLLEFFDQFLANYICDILESDGQLQLHINKIEVGHLLSTASFLSDKKPVIGAKIMV